MTTASLVVNNKNNIDIVLEPVKTGQMLAAADIYDLIKASEYTKLRVNETNIKNAIAELNSVLKPLQQGQKGREIQYQILERIDASITITIDKDEMTAFGEITAAQGGANLTAKSILHAAQQQGVKKGFSKEDLVKLAQLAAKAEPGEIVKLAIALGIPPKDGKDAQIKPLVENAQARILKPRERDDGSVDMRDLGDIICVKVGDPLAQKLPATPGTKGYTVTGGPLEPHAGQDLELKAGEGTRFSQKNANVLISTKVGLPRFKENIVEVDEVYQINNVDVGTGHIKFEGSVIIKGDVHESMKVIASGDITIGGFVESALLEAGGDITIQGGIIGRKQDVENGKITDFVMSAQITAQGSIYAKYCQYAQLKSEANITIENQLMHSIIDVEGRLWVGHQEKANGKLIGGLINAQQSVDSGIIGATAGSHTIIRFEKRIEAYKAELAAIDEKIKAENAKTDELRAAENKLKKVPKAQRNEELFQKIHNTYMHHNKLLAKALEQKQQTDEQLQAYMENVYIAAHEKLYQGVELHVGSFNERSKREYGPSKMRYQERKVIIDPIVHTS